MSRGFLRSTSVVGGFTLLSRVSGLVRDMAYSHAFGAGTLMDAFLVAFKIPNFLRRLTAEGAFSQAFVPVVSEYKVRRGEDEVRDLVGGVAGTLGLGLFVDHRGRCRGGAAAGPAVRARFPRRCGAVRPDGRHAPAHLPVHPLHVAGRPRQRRPQQLRPLCGSRLHPRAAQRRDDRVRHAGGPARGGARHRPRGGCVRCRPGAVAVPAAGPARHPDADLAPLGLGPRGCPPDRQAHVAGHLRILRGTGLAAAGHADCVVPDDWLDRLDVLRRPAGRVSARGLFHRAGHGDPAGAVVPPCGRGSCAVQRDPRLGAAHDDGDRHAGRGRTGDAGRPAGRDDLRLRRVRRA